MLVALLAAGRGERFGGGKLDADLHGRPLGGWALRTARALKSPVVAVVGPEVPEFLADARADITLLPNPDRAGGMGSSLALAARHALTLRADGLLVMLADMPFVRADSLHRLIDAAQPTGAAACRYPGAFSSEVEPPNDLENAAIKGKREPFRFDQKRKVSSGRLGAPACFAAVWLPRLTGLAGDEGARALLNRGGSVAGIDVAPEELADIDTAADLIAARPPDSIRSNAPE